MNDSAFQHAFDEQERRDRISNSKLAYVLAMVLMPAGIALDYFVYLPYLWLFLGVRILVSGILGLVWLWFFLNGGKHDRLFGVLWYTVPTLSMVWMIYYVNAPTSPYYAGLNIVLLAVGLLSPWTYVQNLLSAVGVIGLYLAASCFMKTPQTAVFNNLYFLVLTAIIVVAGSRKAYQQRLREFALRYELDKNKKVLEEQKASLETAIIRLKEAEAELVQTEKLASLGRLSAGIIHEINNPLNYAKTGLYMLKNKGKYVAPDQQADYAETLKDVEEGLARVINIVSDLRSFTHHDDESREQLPMTELVGAALRFVSHEWRDTVRVEQQLAEHQTIWANKNKMIQVLVNLLQNSLDAVNAKAFTDGEKPTVWIESRRENEQNLLVVRDNGMGIKAEQMDKVFDPFFTTKDVGEGMGLGLSICYRIVQEYGGRIRVKSEPGKFCEFTLEFPVKG